MFGEHLAPARLADLMAGPPDALEPSTDRARRLDLNDEIAGPMAPLLARASAGPPPVGAAAVRSGRARTGGEAGRGEARRRAG